jgi:septum formation protein
MTTKRVRWILASASPRRREILGALGLDFEVHPTTSAEPMCRPGEIPAHFAVRAARAKAMEISRLHRAGLVIAADTVVVSDDWLMGKPGSAEEACRMLHRLSGRWHEVITGLCLRECGHGRQRSSSTVSRVHLRRLNKAEIDWYIGTGEYRDKAGAYAIQGFASLFIDRIEGCYFNIVGFPVFGFERLCRRMGIQLSRSLNLTD